MDGGLEKAQGKIAVIAPWLLGLLSWRRAPLTWALIALNAFFFLLTFQTEYPISNVNEERFLLLTGRLYSQYEHGENKGEHKGQAGEDSDWWMAGVRGLRDPLFLETFDGFHYFGDPVEIKSWKKEMALYRDKSQGRFSQLFGVVTDEIRPLSWITYQFMHAGFFHLFSNMILLLIFGGALEAMYGAFGLSLIYITGGIAAGVFYSAVGGLSAAPLVGASGSISTLMAFYACVEVRRRVRYVYFLSPFKGLYGYIWLPTWLMLPMSFLSDIAASIGTPENLTHGVATSAHIGGALFGLAVGFSFRALGRLPITHFQPEQSPFSTNFLSRP